MSFGLSISDIKYAIDGCKWVLDTFFDKNGSPDQQYNDLEKDIKLLDGRLRHLVQALEDAFRPHDHLDLEAADLRRDLKSLIGDFQSTIDKAKSILLHYVKFQRNRSGFIDKVSWEVSGREKVESIRREIQLHSQKIYLIIDPVQLNLLTIMRQDVEEMRILMQEHFSVPTPLPTLPRWLEMRLSEVVYQNPPQQFGPLSQIPLTEGFDALYSHFKESTFAYRDPEIAPQIPEQYLNLLKCQWLLQTLRSGEQFRQARAGSLYPRTLAQMEQKILKQYQRSDLVFFSENVLQNLNPTAFLIWPQEQEIEVKLPTDTDEGEELILKLSLHTSSGNGTDELVIFRTGILTLRIARRFMDRYGRLNYDNQQFNIHHDKFIPFYSLLHNPSARSAGLRRDLSMSSIGIHRANETGTMAYEFQGGVDISKFQRAITGYQVWFSQTIDWAINYSRSPPQGRSLVQIWHYKPLVEEASCNSSLSSPANSMRSPGSKIPAAPDAVVNQILSRKNTAGISITQNSKTDSTVYVETPPHPVIMIFAQHEGRYDYFYIELAFGMQIVPKACKCRKHPGECHRAVIENRYKGSSEKDFLIRRMTVKGEQLSDWNVAVFGQPRHPLFDNKRVVQQMETCRFLQLDFDSVDDRVEFAKRFNKALEMRDKEERNIQGLLNEVSSASEKMAVPERGGKLAKFRPRRESTISTIQETTGSPEFLPPMSRFSSLTMGESAIRIFELSSPVYEMSTPDTSPTANTSPPNTFGKYLYDSQHSRSS